MRGIFQENKNISTENVLSCLIWPCLQPMMLALWTLPWSPHSSQHILARPREGEVRRTVRRMVDILVLSDD